LKCFFLCSHNGDHPQEELAKFGYRSERKVEKSKNPAIIWQPAETYCPNMAISEIVTLVHFFRKNPFYELNWILFFCWQVVKIHPQKTAAL
jgi:hypothetical protein